MTNILPSTAASGVEYRVEPSSSRGPSTFTPPQHARLHPPNEEPSFTFVCLGVGGGPLEGDCSCYMLKPAHREWSEGAVVVEGGSWLGALTRIMEDVGPDSAFADVDFPHQNAALRAGYLASFAHSFIISHAHLDHILGMILGCASLPGKKNVYGLRPTLENLLEVFNGKIWPKLASFTDDGPSAVYLLKVLENQIGAKVDEGFSVLSFALSHGLNPSVPPAPPTPTPVFNMPQGYFSKRYSLPTNGLFTNSHSISPIERNYAPMGDRPVFNSPFAPEKSLAAKMEKSRIEEDDEAEGDSYKFPTAPSMVTTRSKGSKSRRPKTALGSEHVVEDSDVDPLSKETVVTSENATPPKHVTISHRHSPSPPALDSTAFFITNTQTGKDVLFFGDVEPDSISQSPRNKKVWTHAALKYVEGNLNTIFLECSFPAAHPTEHLYGHLSVNFLFDELRSLSRLVLVEKKRQRSRKQKHSTPAALSLSDDSPSKEGPRYTPSASAHTLSIPASPFAAAAANHTSDAELRDTLTGLSIVIIHVKTALFPSYCAPATSPTTAAKTDDGEGVNGAHFDAQERLVDPRTMQERILEELVEIEEEAGLGVRFVMAKQGMRIEC
ncbi:hypothetical protein CBS101457_006751 [Exobasidium rhododendri]|nr:hypothetical protein CBS101457_006751 [Exobasidium rhododendri]